jgi:arabinofuranosyltransferase
MRGAVLAVCWAILLVQLARIQPWTVDDAYIVFRYAENWVSGHGPVYNPGEWVEGYSSPLWLLLLAGAHALGLDTELASKLLGVGAAAAAPALLVRAERTGLAALLAGTSGAWTAWAGGGLEATFAGWVALLAWWGHASGHRWTPLVSALAPLVRPELLLIPLVQGLDHLRARRGRQAGALLLAVLVLVGGHELLRLWAYGWPLPNPFYAKVGSTQDQLRRGWEHLQGYCLSGGPVLGLALAAGYAVRPSWTPAALWVGLHVAFVVAVGGDALPAWRFFVPVVPVAAWGAGLLLQQAFGRWALLPAALIAVWQLVWVELDPRQLPRMEEVISDRGREVGLWLRAHFPPGTLIAVNTAGTVPYYSGLPAIDMLGLCDEHIAHVDAPAMGLGLAGHEKADGAYVLSRAPDLVIFGAAQGRRAPIFRSDHQLAAQPAFRERYVFETWPLPSGRRLHVWRRRDAPLPAAGR